MVPTNTCLIVTLRALDAENWEACIQLRVTEEQEDFVAKDLYSIAQTRFEPTWIPLVIYDGDTMVGFIMYDEADYEITRLMIDKAHQGKGYGRSAMELIIEQFELKLAHPTTSTSYVPANHVAERLYLSLGFCKTGKINDGEVVVQRVLRQRRDTDHD
mgnify:CR=1 FL=1